LNAIAAPVEAEAKKRGYRPSKDRDERRFLHFLGQLPELLADQERRAKQGPHAPVVCIGPSREADPTKRIVALIARLDEVSARQWGQPGGVNLGSDPVVTALIREGDAALDPLLDCFAKDNRLTRSVHFWRDFTRDRTALAVHEAAYVAIGALLHRSDFEPRATGDNLTNAGPERRKALAEQIRQHRKTHKETPLIDRMFRSLANDKAAPEQWLRAAAVLVEPDNVMYTPSTTVYSGGAVRRPLGPGEKPRLKGEPLRGKKKPSVTELMVKRIGQVKDGGEAARLAMKLLEWDAPATKPLLAGVTTRCRESQSWYRYQELIFERALAGDTGGLDDYVKWVRSVTPEIIGHREAWVYFQLMWNYPNHPGMAEAAEWLFTNNSSPWVPLLRVDKEGRGVCEWGQFLGSPLLAFSGFRKAVLARLLDKSGKGTVHAERDGLSYDLSGIPSSSEGRTYPDPEVPKEGIRGTFRICDFVAWKIGEEIPGAPRCELYWLQERRDAAVAACAEFLRHYGPHVAGHDDLNLPRLNRLATKEQVRKGDAIFSLEDEGKVRVVKLPELPMYAHWVTLKDLPYEKHTVDPKTGKERQTLAYQQDGKVYQAEEVFKEGKWQRYFGFVGAHRVARVPAAEIEFPPPESGGWTEPLEWLRLGDGFDCRLEPTRPKDEVDEDFVPRWPAGSAPVCGLELWNRSGVEREMPDLATGVRPRLYYSPETVSRQGMLVPAAARANAWEELKPLAGATLKMVPHKRLATAERVLACRIDVASWFPVQRGGFYRLVLTSRGGSSEEAREFRFSVAPAEKREKGQ
jgi:hypothetical protein